MPQAGVANAGADKISIDDFRKIDLRVARITQAAPLEGADKLLKLEVDLGDEKRTLVAGIAKHYRDEELIGRSVVIVANLQPTKIRGVESQGMVLAAQGDGQLVLITPLGDIQPGSKIS
jgi:methionyl-tRNA synthetase